VKITVVTPCRDDFTSARRAAKQLALAGQAAALYCHMCGRCCEIQDTDDPRLCCGRVRLMLAVIRPERRKLIPDPVSPPGGVAPRWVNAVQPPRLPGQLPVPELADLAALALRRRVAGGPWGTWAGTGSIADDDEGSAQQEFLLAWKIRHDPARMQFRLVHRTALIVDEVVIEEREDSTLDVRDGRVQTSPGTSP